MIMTTLKKQNQQLSKQHGALLPDDNIEEILVSLPFKSLLRFKSVCKSWCSLVNSQRFARANYINSRRRQTHDDTSLVLIRSLNTDCGYIRSPYVVESTNGLKQDQKVEQKKQEWPTVPKYLDFYKIRCSCDGILCMVRDGETVALWNPFINKLKMLPNLKGTNFGYNIIGFGYDSTINDYKVVRVSRDNALECKQIEVLNLKSNVWRSVHKNFRYNDFHRETEAVSFNGGLYFLATKGALHASLLRFDLVKETLKEVLMPPSLPVFEDYDYIKYLLFGSLQFGLLGGTQLYLIFYVPETSSSELWVMKEENCWVKLFCIPKKPYKYDKRPLCNTNDGALLVLNMLRDIFLIYDPECNNVCELDQKCEINARLEQATAFSKSLISPFDVDA